MNVYIWAKFYDSQLLERPLSRSSPVKWQMICLGCLEDSFNRLICEHVVVISCTSMLMDKSPAGRQVSGSKSGTAWMSRI